MVKKVNRIIKSTLIYLFGIVFLIPIIWIFSLSLRSKKGVYSVMFFTKELHFENYITAWQEFNFSRLFLNSVVVTGISVLLTLFIASLAGYAFSKLKYKGSNVVFFAVLSGIMIPPAAIIIPFFIMMSRIGLYNNLISLILSYIAFGLPLSILIFRGFFLSIPDELIEAARIDGYNEIGIYFRIALPLSRPAIAAVIIFLFMMNWNEFLLALVLLVNKTLYTLPLGISIYVGQYNSPWELIGAGVIISSIPIFIIYLIFQKQFIKGLTAGAVKG